MAIGLSYRTGSGHSIVFADESSYQFQAKVFANGQLKGPATPVTVAQQCSDAEPLAFKHIILDRSGRFSKYPTLWPAVLAIGERAGASWAVTPLLGCMLLVLLALLAFEAFGSAAVLPSVWMAVLSPFLLSYCSGKMSHALCAVLLTTATLFCLRGIRTGRTADFTMLFVALILSFHVRPYTAFVFGGVLGIGLLWHYRRSSAVLLRLLPLTFVAGCVAAGSELIYNWAFTGHVFLSPYALYDGAASPADLKLSPMVLLKHLLTIRRESIQNTMLYSFPFVFALAGYGYWTSRRSVSTGILAALFPAMFAANLATLDSSPIAGERFFFEAFIPVLVLAGHGLHILLQNWRTSPAIARYWFGAASVVQAGMLVLAAWRIDGVSRPYQEITKLAEAHRDCHCVVFLQSTSDLHFFSHNLNLNDPEWRKQEVYFMNDPGPDKRAEWARIFGWNDWALLSFNPTEQTAMFRSDSDRKVYARDENARAE